MPTAGGFRWGIALVAFGAIALLLGGSAFAIWFVLRIPPNHPDGLLATPPAVAPSAPEPVAPPSVAPAFEPDPDPFAEDVPPALAPIRERVARGAPLTAANRSTLRRLVIQGRSDPRPWLVLAHGDLLEGARTDACERYERALSLDVRATRGDRNALPNLITLAAHHVTHERAADLIRRHWGARAIPDLEAAIGAANGERDDEEMARLRTLREQLEAGATVDLGSMSE